MTKLPALPVSIGVIEIDDGQDCISGYSANQMRAYAKLAIASAQFNLLRVIAEIREKTGVGDKPMLSELADAIVSTKRKSRGKL